MEWIIYMIMETLNLLFTGKKYIEDFGTKKRVPSRLERDWNRMEEIHKRENLCSTISVSNNITVEPGTVSVTSNVPVNVSVTKTEGQVTYSFSF